MTQAKQKPTTLTFEAYLDYDDGTDILYELVDGELQAMTPVDPEHSDIVDFLYDLFKEIVKRTDKDWKIKQLGVGFRTSLKKSRLPDVCIIKGEDWRALKLRKAKSAVLEVPLVLAVEVVSPYRNRGEKNYIRDYVHKWEEYAKRQVPEYWIIDPQASKVTVLVLDENTCQYPKIEKITPLRGNDLIKSSIKEITDLNLTAEQILSAR